MIPLSRSWSLLSITLTPICRRYQDQAAGGRRQAHEDRVRFLKCRTIGTTTSTDHDRNQFHDGCGGVQSITCSLSPPEPYPRDFDWTSTCSMQSLSTLVGSWTRHAKRPHWIRLSSPDGTWLMANNTQIDETVRGIGTISVGGWSEWILSRSSTNMISCRSSKHCAINHHHRPSLLVQTTDVSRDLTSENARECDFAIFGKYIYIYFQSIF